VSSERPADPPPERKLRVFIIYNCIPHYRVPIFELLSKDPEVEFTIVTDSKTDTPFLPVATAEERARMRFAEAPLRRFRWRRRTEFYWQPKAIGLVYRERPDVVIVLGTPYSFTAWALVALGRILDCPVLLWGHGLLRQEGGIKWQLRRALYAMASGQLLYGDYAKRLLTANGFREDTLRVVYNSLDADSQLTLAASIGADETKAWRATLGVHSEERVVTFIGRLQPVKRLDLLVRAIGLLARRGRRVHAVLIGEGTQGAALAALARTEHVSELVHLVGAIYAESDLGTVLSGSDLCVIPSGAGLTVMHALAYGTPVVLHDNVGEHFPEWEAVEEGVTGTFYKYDSTDDLAAKMETALFPAPLKERVGERCKQVIRERYHPEYQRQVFVQTAKEFARRG
jgi:glycosyltransferase involved in cell wall biosynthesis